MASPFESLPIELFDAIVDEVELTGLSRLSQCNKSFQKVFEPRLYSFDSAQNKAMWSACMKNYPDLIKKLVTRYNARTNFVLVNHPAPYPTAVLTLYLCAKKGHAEAFAMLLSLGAQVDLSKPSLCTTKRTLHLMRRLCRPTERHLLQLFFDAITDSRLHLSQFQLDQALLLLISSDAPLDLISRIIDFGANPSLSYDRANQKMSRKVYPLSAAILLESPSIFSLLLERGASIHGTNPQFPNVVPLHLPVFAATSVLLKSGPAMLEMCLENGADINQCSPAIPRAYRPFKATVTPIDIVVDAMLNLPNKKKRARLLKPAKALQFLLNNGAILGDSFRPLWNEHSYTFLRHGVYLEPTMEKCLRTPEFVAAIASLAPSPYLQRNNDAFMAEVMEMVETHVDSRPLKLMFRSCAVADFKGEDETRFFELTVYFACLLYLRNLDCYDFYSKLRTRAQTIAAFLGREMGCVGECKKVDWPCFGHHLLKGPMPNTGG